jgi:hypothetical protein
MIVLVAGMQRSGSTFSFNVVKEILQKRGDIRLVVSSSVFDELNKKRPVAIL